MTVTSQYVFRCDLCPFMTAGGKPVLDVHKKKFHGVRETMGHPCPKCPFKADSMEGLKNHLLKAHSTAPAMTRSDCQLCEFSCASEQALSRHMVDTHGVPESMANNKIKCHVCMEGFDSQPALQTHMWNLHNINSALNTSSSDLNIKISSVVGGMQ